jgi:hypothetical protein
MAPKPYQDGIEDPILVRVDSLKEWRVGKRTGSLEVRYGWANCEIILEYNSKNEEELTVVKDGVRVCSWTKIGFSIKPPKRQKG